jgi:hypothetical protein
LIRASKLAVYPRQNQIACALNEIGQLEQTTFILELLSIHSFVVGYRAGCCSIDPPDPAVRGNDGIWTIHS